jgi:hypothetical protein
MKLLLYYERLVPQSTNQTWQVRRRPICLLLSGLFGRKDRNRLNDRYVGMFQNLTEHAERTVLDFETCLAQGYDKTLFEWRK